MSLSYLAQELPGACAHIQAHRVYKTQPPIKVLLIQPALIMHQHHITNLQHNTRNNKTGQQVVVMMMVVVVVVAMSPTQHTSVREHQGCELSAG